MNERGAELEGREVRNKQTRKQANLCASKGTRDDWHYVMTGQGQATSEIGQRLTPRPSYMLNIHLGLSSCNQKIEKFKVDWCGVWQLFGAKFKFKIPTMVRFHHSPKCHTCITFISTGPITPICVNGPLSTPCHFMVGISFPNAANSIVAFLLPSQSSGCSEPASQPLPHSRN